MDCFISLEDVKDYCSKTNTNQLYRVQQYIDNLIYEREWGKAQRAKMKATKKGKTTKTKETF